MIVCPCCAGRGEVADVAPIHLTPTERRIVAAVERAAHVGIETRDLVSLLYKDEPTGGPERADLVVRVQICRLNKKLAAIGRRIQGTYGPGAVYRMVSAWKHVKAA